MTIAAAVGMMALAVTIFLFLEKVESESRRWVAEYAKHELLQTKLVEDLLSSISQMPPRKSETLDQIRRWPAKYLLLLLRFQANLAILNGYGEAPNWGTQVQSYKTLLEGLPRVLAAMVSSGVIYILVTGINMVIPLFITYLVTSLLLLYFALTILLSTWFIFLRRAYQAYEYEKSKPCYKDLYQRLSTN